MSALTVFQFGQQSITKPYFVTPLRRELRLKKRRGRQIWTAVDVEGETTKFYWCSSHERWLSIDSWGTQLLKIAREPAIT